MTQNKNAILNHIFGISSNDVNALINNVGGIHKGNLPENTNNDYEFELRFIDGPRKDCSVKTYKELDLSQFHEIIYSDNVYISYNTLNRNTKIREMYSCNDYRDMLNNKTKPTRSIMKKTNISSISTKKQNSNQKNSKYNKRNNDNITPLMIKFNLETTMNADKFELTNVSDYQRRQRISYKSNIPLLSNWRVDKTVRFYTNNKDNKKLTYKLDKDNVINPKLYDSLDIEFEYVGEYTQLEPSLFKLFEVLYPSQFRLFNIDYNNINNILKSKYNYDLINLFTQVGIITNKFIQEEDINDFVYEEKYDGERVILILTINKGTITIFEYTKMYFKQILKHHDKSLSDSIYIIDCEKLITQTAKMNDDKENDTSKQADSKENDTSKQPAYNDSHTYDNININKDVDSNKDVSNEVDNIIESVKYVCFDCLLYDGVDLNEKDYLERIRYTDSFVDNFNNLIDIVCVRCYQLKAKDKDETYNKWKKLIHIVNSRYYSNVDELKGAHIDGLVLHKNKANFINGQVFKLKNVLMLTTDFKLIWIPEKNVYYLYLVGKTSDLLRTLPINNRYSKQHFGYSLTEETKGVYMLFDSPFIASLYEFEPSIDWYEEDNKMNKFLTDDTKKEITDMLTKICKNPMSYNNKVIEMTLYGNHQQKWLPLRVRQDKEYSNGYKVGLSNVECIYNHLSPKYCKQPIDNNNYDYFYKFIMEKYFNEKGKFNSLLWHTNNSSQINNILGLCSINDVFIVSKDKLVLTEACNMICNDTAPIISLSNQSKVYNRNEKLNMNCIHFTPLNERKENKIANGSNENNKNANENSIANSIASSTSEGNLAEQSNENIYETYKENIFDIVYEKLLRTNFITQSIKLYIESAFEDITDMDEYINFLRKVIIKGGYYIIISPLRLQNDNKNKLTELLTEYVINERIFNNDDGEIMFLSIFTK